MATRSTIAFEYENGEVKQIYCHWDGYLEHNGKLLYNLYMEPEKVKQLIELGNLSSLGETFEKCYFYARDFHESEEENVALEFRTVGDYMKDTENKEEYNYIMLKDGIWYLVNGTITSLDSLI